MADPFTMMTNTLQTELKLWVSDTYQVTDHSQLEQVFVLARKNRGSNLGGVVVALH